ncbi:MAG: YidC/Oxa1 family membrane protein insertase [bacterium]|nr:YidC/Oxa1 family membrane protein insertase [bacterium]
MNLFDLFITQPIFNLLLVIYNFVGDFGVAIIIFTIITKVILWPLTKSQLHQTKVMKKIQPELKKIRQNSNGNRQVESLQMMELYKRHNVKPFRSMLTMLIQIPILLTLFSVIRIVAVNQTEISKFVYQPVSQLSRVSEIMSNPESFQPTLFGVVRLSETALPINSKSAFFLFLIALVSSALQWYLVRQTQGEKKKRKLRDIMNEAAQGKEADQTEINQIVSSQMSFMMPVMMFFIMANLYGALAFYYFVSNVIQALQQKYIFDLDKKELEEIAKADSKTKNAKEAKIISNSKKTAGKVRRIKAKDDRRKK